MAEADDVVSRTCSALDDLAIAQPETSNSITSSPKIETLAKGTLSMQVDCVGWNRRNNILAVGGYQIDPEDTSVRLGLLYLITIDSSLPSGYSIVHEESVGGVLDLKWEPVEETRLALASSKNVTIFELIKDGEKFDLNVLFAFALDDASMALYVEWLKLDQILYSDSQGNLNILEITSVILERGGQTRVEKVGGEEEILGSDGTKTVLPEEGIPPVLVLVDKVHLHDYLVWVVHFDSISDIIYSGSDDGTFTAFRLFDFTNSGLHYIKKFEVGVTSVTTKCDMVAIGCYDDILRIYTRTIPADPEGKLEFKYHTEIKLGGTIWRTIWIPNITVKATTPTQESDNSDLEYKIGVAAARNGIHIVTLKRPSWTWEKNISCMDYVDYLAYGFDIKENSEEKSYTVASCYFDNHALHVWKFKEF